MPSPPTSITHAPGPWRTKCETWWMTVTLGGKLPEGAYDPLEEKVLGDVEDVGKFAGGLGLIMVVRYSETPVGPYDELLLIPGVYTIPPLAPNTPPPPSLRRISRIYVSARSTVYNGRYNWNIPKHLARFHFTISSSHPSSPPSSLLSTTTVDPKLPPGAVKFEVSPPTGQTGPFMKGSFVPLRWVPGFALSTRWLPLSSMLAQPPVSSGKNTNAELKASSEPSEENTWNEGEVLVGTDAWFKVPINAYSPNTAAVWVQLDDLGEGKEEAKKHWPLDVQPWSLGVWLRNAEIEIPEGEKWVKETRARM